MSNRLSESTKSNEDSPSPFTRPEPRRQEVRDIDLESDLLFDCLYFTQKTHG